MAGWSTGVDVPFIGRVDELLLLRRLLDSAIAGQPRIALLSGEAGVGKSCLLAEAMAAARARGATVLHGACYEDVGIPYLPIAVALRPLDHPGVRWLASRDAGERGAPEDAEERRMRLFLDATAALIDTAKSDPTLLVLDDLHWADDATAELVRHLVLSAVHESTVADLPLLVVLSARGPWPEGLPNPIARIARDAAALELHLERFGIVEAHALISAVAGGRPRTETVRALLEATAGNPLLLRGVLARNLAAGSIVVRDGEVVLATDRPLAAPTDLDEEIRLELARLDAPSRQALSVAAVLGDGQSTATLRAALGPELEPSLATLFDIGLLREDRARHRFSHPQVRHVAYEDLKTASRAALHLQVARALEQSVDDPDGATALAIADHLRRGGADADDRTVAQWALRAGDHAWASGAWDDARAAYALALSGAGRDALSRPELVSRLVRAGVAAYYANDDSSPDWLAQAEQVAAEEGDLLSRAEAVLLRARFDLIGSAAAVGARPEPEDLLQLLPDLDGEPSLLARALTTLADLHFVGLDHTAAAEYARQAEAVLAQLADDPPVVGRVHFVLGLQDMAGLDLESAGRHFAVARREGDDHLQLAAATRAGLCHLVAGRLDLALDDLRLARQGERGLASHAGQQLPAAGLAEIDVLHTEYANAEQLCAEVESLYSIQEYAFTPGLVYPMLAAARAVRGDLEGAQDAMDRWRSAGGRGTWRYELYLIVLAGDLEKAAAAVRDRPWRTVRDITCFTLDIPCLHVLVGGHLDEAELIRGGLPSLVDAHQRGVVLTLGWPWLLSRVIADGHRHLGEVAAAERWYHRAEAEATATGSPVEQALVLLGRGRLAMSHGRSGEASRLASDAAAELDAAGALLLATDARELVAQSGEHATADPIERVILFTDMVGSTELNVRAGDQRYHALLGEHDRILRSRIRRHDGVEFSHTGDGMSAWFSSSDDAIACAFGIRSDLERATVGHPELPVRVRFGITCGRPVHDGERLFGLAVVEAARVCALAVGDQVLVSDRVRERATGDVVLRSVGARTLKGMPGQHELFEALGGAAG
jgi:class 3 adenylate cyclase